MSNVALLLSVSTLWALAVVSPGPNFLMTARLAVARSRRAGLQAVAGIAVGTVCWAAAGCFGVRALFIAAPWMYLSVKLAGAIYLIFTGAQLTWSSWNRKRDLTLEPPGIRPKVPPFHLGLLTTLANPRSAVSVASIFATAHAEPSLSHPQLYGHDADGDDFGLLVHRHRLSVRRTASRVPLSAVSSGDRSGRRRVPHALWSEAGSGTLIARVA
jgi:threonine/homoserine/homoserine lactone efflux protein